MTFANARFAPAAPAAGASRYVYHDPRIVPAVNIALATRRPLMVTGVPGSGKSSLAPDIARQLGWAYLRETLTSRTRSEDLVATFDAVDRLNDAQVNRAGPIEDYLVPGALWWTFDPATASGLRSAVDPRANPDGWAAGTVLLLDEIDKAEPDLPNDLLEPLDSLSITVRSRGRLQARHDVLVVITSNGERAMPPAFLRRCIRLELDDRDPSFFVEVATSHFGPGHDSLYADLASHTLELGEQAELAGGRRPSMAEYIDAVRACLSFGERPGGPGREATPLWAAIEEAALRKTPRPGDAERA